MAKARVTHRPAPLSVAFPGRDHGEAFVGDREVAPVGGVAGFGGGQLLGDGQRLPRGGAHGRPPTAYGVDVQPILRPDLEHAPGWRVAALPGRMYPGLVTGKGSATGLLLTDLTPGEWLTLDAFEDDIYELRRLSLAGGRHGWAYVCRDDTEASPCDWDAEGFAERQLPAYVERCTWWRRRYNLTPTDS